MTILALPCWYGVPLTHCCLMPTNVELVRGLTSLTLLSPIRLSSASSVKGSVCLT